MAETELSRASLATCCVAGAWPEIFPGRTRDVHWRGLGEAGSLRIRATTPPENPSDRTGLGQGSAVGGEGGTVERRCGQCQHSASKALQDHNGGRFENAEKPEFKEVSGLWNRATGALEKAEQAEKLEAEDGKEIEAARLMHEAAVTYPEMPGLAFAAESYDEGVAFLKHDYDAFLAIAEKQWKQQNLPETAAAVASALACKYAITADIIYRQRSEEMFKTARQLAQGNADALKGLDEFEERNYYRLESRTIISKQEYDRRFRSVKVSK